MIYAQQRKISVLLDAKSRYDAQIHPIQVEMDANRDSIRLAELEHKLLETTASAERALAELARTRQE